MKIVSYKTKLTTHATTAGAGFLFGWYDEIDSKLRDGTLSTPFITVEPTQWVLNSNNSSFKISFKFNTYIKEATNREAAFDSAIVIINKFIDAINTDDNLEVVTAPVADLIDFGTLVEDYYVLKINTQIKIWC